MAPEEKKRKSLSKLAQRLLPHPPVRPTDLPTIRRDRSGWKERLKGLFIAKVSPAGNRRNGGYIRPYPSTLYITYVWSIMLKAIIPCVSKCVLAGREEGGLLNFKISTSIFQVITQRLANQGLICFWHAQCCELMFMSWWLSHGCRRNMEMQQCFY